MAYCRECTVGRASLDVVKLLRKVLQLSVWKRTVA